MNITSGRAFPFRVSWSKLQYASLVAGLTLALSAAFVMERQADSSNGGGLSSSIPQPGLLSLSAPQPQKTIYLVDSQADAGTLAIASHEELGGGAIVMILTAPDDEASVALMIADQAHGVIQGVNVIDLRSP